MSGDFTAKIDALDFVIDVLKEHEKELDAALSKMEELITRLEELERKLGK